MVSRKKHAIEYGPVAQLGERRVRNAEVESSILFGSTSNEYRRTLADKFFVGEGFPIKRASDTF